MLGCGFSSLYLGTSCKPHDGLYCRVPGGVRIAYGTQTTLLIVVLHTLYSLNTPAEPSVRWDVGEGFGVKRRKGCNVCTAAKRKLCKEEVQCREREIRYE